MTAAAIALRRSPKNSARGSSLPARWRRAGGGPYRGAPEAHRGGPRIDSDCIAAPQWLSELLPGFESPQVAAVGGWVDGMHDEAALDRYEAVMSSLNLGRRAMSGGSGDDTFYLPCCNLLVRSDAFVRAGGFRVALHVGEDVDLTWRLRDVGRSIVYLPGGRSAMPIAAGYGRS